MMVGHYLLFSARGSAGVSAQGARSEELRTQPAGIKLVYTESVPWVRMIMSEDDHE